MRARPITFKTAEDRRVGRQRPGTYRKPQFQGLPAVVAKRQDRETGQADGAAPRPCLGRLDADATLNLFEGALDPDRRAVKVEIVPTQRRKLASPGAAPDCQGGDGKDSVPLQLSEHVGDLIGVEDLNLGSGHLWGPNRSGDVAVEHFDGGSVGQGRP